MSRIVAGSYDRFLFGYQCSTPGSAEEAALDRAFVYPAHKAPVKCIASSAPYLASGGADDLVHLYDLQAGTDLGFLMNPGEGAVSAVAFYAPDASHYPSHLLSGAADGGITVWQAGSQWVCLKTLRGHKKEVSSIALHPSGRLALSTGRDSSLRLWNLVRGKAAHTAALQAAADQVVFSPTGDCYSLTCGGEVLVHEVGADEPRLRLPHARRPLCLAFAAPQLLLSGSEAGALQLWDLRQGGGAPASELPGAHAARLRGVCPLPGAAAAGEPGLVATAASDGAVRLWDWRTVSGGGAVGKPLSEAATNARLTCLTALEPAAATRRVAPARAAAEPKARHMQQAGQGGQPAPAKKQQQQQQQRRAVQPQRRAVAAAAEGVAHDGVVEFPDAAGGKKGKKGKRRRQAEAGERAAPACKLPAGKAGGGKAGGERVPGKRGAGRLGPAKAGVQKGKAGGRAAREQRA